MTKLFGTNNKVVIGTIVNSIPGQGYFFVQNGEPQQIFCHIKQGGRLNVTANGKILFSSPDEGMYIPGINRRVALVRTTENPEDKLYTKASMWVPIVDWENCSWTSQLHETYRVIGYNHSVDDIPNDNPDQILAEGTLQGLISAINNGRKDLSGRTFEAKAGGIVFKNDIAWEILRDKRWVTCPCPLPRHLQR